MSNVLYKGDTPLATIAPKDASELPYSNGVSVKDKIDSNYETLNAKIKRYEFINKQALTFSDIPSTCTGFLFLRSYTSSAQGRWTLTPINVYSGTGIVDTPLNIGSDTRYPTSASYSNGTLTINLTDTGSFFATLIYCT